ncbi:MAG: hypothetical protein KC420_21080 [Myxococcales bacterium]|nr:hypothetical protein [Myxococcales bacterium]MCB9568573.1 hypothetical protein [Myxococcales bacterium]MCB9701953.1 hypothetical protein [Myxococcales bacterium]
MATQQAARLTRGDDAVEEIYYRKGDIDFCFLLNRRHHNLRVFDYRVGNYQQKRDFFDRIARAEGLRKVFTVVEKQDSKSWRSVGFSREGAIPGYFRTADAYIMSRVYTEEGEPIQGGAPKLNPPALPSLTVKEKQITKPRGLTSELVTDITRLESITRELGLESCYAPFRRGVFNPDVGLFARLGRRDLWVGAETDASFGHAKVDMITRPGKEADLPVLEYCLKVLLEELARNETASVFAVCAADDLLSNQAYGELGFKVTARLTDHLTRDDEFVGAQVWHRRLSPSSAQRLAG